MVIDLHLTKEITDSPYYDPKNSLSIQLDILDKELDNAIVKSISELTVIHGVGEGILKKEVHKILKAHPYVREFTNDYGSTKVIFK
jgi:hypothetical protein